MRRAISAACALPLCVIDIYGKECAAQVKRRGLNCQICGEYSFFFIAGQCVGMSAGGAWRRDVAGYRHSCRSLYRRVQPGNGKPRVICAAHSGGRPVGNRVTSMRLSARFAPRRDYPRRRFDYFPAASTISHKQPHCVALHRAHRLSRRIGM
jgi:hypothetical protein